MGRGAGYLSIEIVISMFSGYVFWFILAKITTTDIIGISAAVISVASIFMTVSRMSLSTGLQRFFGKSYAEQNFQNCRVLVNASLFLTIIGFTSITIFILITRSWIVDVFQIDADLIPVVIFLIGASSIFGLLRSSVIASLKTNFLPIIMSISTVAKIGLTIFLIMAGWGAFGLIIGYTIYDAMAAILLAFNLLFILKQAKNKSTMKFFQSCKNIFKASSVSWVPSLITAFGTHLGTITVFGSHGAAQAGVYFIAFSITSAFFLLMGALHGIAYPKLSGMQDGRKRFAWTSTKISLLIFIPFSSSVIFYSKEILQLFGESYAQGYQVLEILMISMMPLVVMNGVRILVYAYGNYKQVLAIGMGLSFPRIALYLTLVPIYGSLGAGASYTIGALIGFFVSIIIANKIGMKIIWKELVIILVIPTVLSYGLSYFEINFVLGILITVIISYLLYAKLNILTKQDVDDSVKVLPKTLAQPSSKTIYYIAKKLNLFRDTN